MGLNIVELTVILGDVVQFLECLGEVKLPTSLESIRDSLLIRSKDTLTMLARERIEGPASLEPYLNMNATGSKGLMATLKTEAELQEYVGAEEHHETQKQQQDYYETFQEVGSTSNAALAVHELPDNVPNKNEKIENTVVDIYASFSAAQTKSKCQMCGPLYKKEGKKLFVFEQYRACWVGLVGLHLLIYGNDRENRPYTILPIEGYTARAAPSVIPRDQRRSESTFEIFCPGNRTFQFVAKTPKDMEQWVIKICELGGKEKNDNKEFTKRVDNVAVNNDIAQTNNQENLNCNEEQYQDVGSLSVDKPSDEASIVSNVNKDIGRETDDSLTKDAFREPINTSVPSAVSSEGVVTASRSHAASPPPLPARIPRRLPTLPVRHSSYEFPEEEEDDIYHKIEDFRDTVQYGNVGEVFPIKTKDRTITYDDVRAGIKSEHQRKSDQKRKKKSLETSARKSIGSRKELTYNDAKSTMSKDNKVVEQQSKFVSYDDIESTISNSKSTKVRPTVKTDESVKSPQKKSFLDRVRNKKESPRKTEKKLKCKTSTPSLQPSLPLLPPMPLSSMHVNDEELPTYYDDISDLTIVQQETNRFEEEQSEYTCPPPPRPIYAKPPVIVDVIDTHEFYDDVVAYRDKSKDNHETSKLHRQTLKTPNLLHDVVTTDTDQLVFCENIHHSQRSFEDNEHYKTPRLESRYPKCLTVGMEQTDDLYDDIAILAEFTARQKEVFSNKDNEGITRSQINQEKRTWNRFVSGRKSKAIDPMVAEINGRVLNTIEDSPDDLGEQHGSLRMNTFQKLISKMENSLGKTSAKTASSMLLNKTNLTNNV